MVDGLCDVAYTMYWNALTFGVPLDGAFDAVCDNNLTKFVRVSAEAFPEGALERSRWGLNRDVQWPPEVVTVEIIAAAGGRWAVGKDANGKVRKPSSYRSVDLQQFLEASAG